MTGAVLANPRVEPPVLDAMCLTFVLKDNQNICINAESRRECFCNDIGERKARY